VNGKAEEATTGAGQKTAVPLQADEGVVRSGFRGKIMETASSVVLRDELLAALSVIIKTLTYAVMLPLIASLACGVRNEIERIHRLGNILDANPSDKEILMQLVEYLNNPNPSLRTQAVSAMGNLGAKHSDILGDAVVPLLIARLRDNDAFVRRYAVKGLGQYGRKAEPAVDPLQEVLTQYKEEDSSWLAADVLGNLGPAAISAVPELIKSLDEKGPEGSIHEFAMQKSAGMALYRLSPLGRDGTTELRGRVRRLSGEACLYVALAILKSQPRDPQGTKALAGVLTAEDKAAGVALREIDGIPVTLFDLNVLLPALDQCSRSTDEYVRRLSSKQFARFKASASR